MKSSTWKYLLYILAFGLVFAAIFFFPGKVQVAEQKDVPTKLALGLPFSVESRWSTLDSKDGQFVATPGDTWFVYGWFGAIESNKSGGTNYQLFGNRHQGIDFSARYGLPVLAAAEGQVSFVGDFYGKTIIIAHRDSYNTVYGHLSKQNVTAGQEVKKGDKIGEVGNSGTVNPHLHFELRRHTKDGLWLINPRKLLEVDWDTVFIPDVPANRFFEGNPSDPDAQPDVAWPQNLK